MVLKILTYLKFQHIPFCLKPKKRIYRAYYKSPLPHFKKASSKISHSVWLNGAQPPFSPPLYIDIKKNY